MRARSIVYLALASLLFGCPDDSPPPQLDQADSEDVGDLQFELDVTSEPDVASEPDVPAPACNGHAHLCDWSVDQVLFPMTHNSMAAEEHQFVAPNHIFGIPTQLEDGIRGFMLDLLYDNGEAALCHGFCDIGRIPLAEGLGYYAEFLADNPREVIVLILENYVDLEDVEAGFADSELLPHVHSHTPGDEWVTLGELVENEEQIIVLTDQNDDAFPWIVPVWEVAWETDWSNHSLDDLDCERNRGSADNELFIMNNFLYNQPPAELPLPSLAEKANVNPFLIDRVTRCEEETGHLPNFIVVDFYSIGDLLEVADTVNGWQR